MKSVFNKYILAFILIISTSAFCQNVVVEVESKNVRQGESFYLTIYLDTDTPISALIIPMQIPNTDLSIDSVSFEHSIFQPPFRRESLLTDANRKANISCLPSAPQLPIVYPPGGEVCRLFMTVEPDAFIGFIPIDSFYTIIYIGGMEVILDIVQASDNQGTSAIFPDFISGSVWVDITTAVDDYAILPNRFNLQQNYPNPFNPTTEIIFSLPSKQAISLIVYNILGNKIAELADGVYPAGVHHLEWDGSDYPSGTYFYRLSSAEKLITRKMILIK